MQLAGYELGGKIGEGGMATVYRGQQLSLERPVAIKVLSNGLLTDEVVRQSFEREARLVASLNHPHIIHIIDRGVMPQGQPYFVMEYVEGVDLAQAIRLNNLSFQRRLALCLQICQAIAYAHKNGIIHRDIKPANVIVDKQGHARVLDFGIAMLVEEKNVEAMGTANYMAPELLYDNACASEKTDIYALGLLMYELLAGMPPPRRQAYRPIAHAQPAFPAELDRLLSECLDVSPERRPPDVSHIYQRLLQISAGAHLSSTQRQRAQESFGKKNHVLLDVLKECSDGAVYLFEERNSRQLLVLKKRNAGSGGYKEAQRLLHLEHPNLARVLGVSGNERLFVVAAEYLAGGTLAERLLSPWELPEFYVVARAVTSALLHAARNGLHHGQLRPSNILFTQDGVVRVADFGFAADEEAAQSPYDCCRVTGIEVCDHEQADVFSAGVIFHEMLLGEKPVFERGALKPSRQWQRLPGPLKLLLQRMLCVQRQDACQRFAEVLLELDAQQSEAETCVLASATSAAATPARWPWLMAGLILLAAAGLLLKNLL